MVSSCVAGVNRGAWYFEVKITDMPAETAARIGWAQAVGVYTISCMDKLL